MYTDDGDYDSELDEGSSLFDDPSDDDDEDEETSERGALVVQPWSPSIEIAGEWGYVK